MLCVNKKGSIFRKQFVQSYFCFIPVHYVSQKYRVAIALAILKSKPTELTVNQYMDNLKNKLNEKMDIDEISINSNDFNYDEEIFNEFNDRINDTYEKDVSRNETNDSATILGDFGVQNTNDCLVSYTIDFKCFGCILFISCPYPTTYIFLPL